MNNVINAIDCLITGVEVSSFNTTIFSRNKARHEKLCTLLEYLKMGRLEPGQKILIAEVKKDVNGREHSSHTETLYVGNCTPYIQPSTSDGGEGWDWKHPRMSKFVLEVHESF